MNTVVKRYFWVVLAGFLIIANSKHILLSSSSLKKPDTFAS